MPDNPDPPDELLDRAIATLKNSPASEAPSQHLLDEALAALTAAESASANVTHFWKNLIVKQSPKIGAAAVLMIGLVGVILWMQGRPGTAFADVLNQLADLHSVRYNQTIASTSLGNPTAQAIDVIATDDGRERCTSASGPIVCDYRKKKYLSLDGASKTAYEGDLSAAAPFGQINLIQMFQTIDKDSGRLIGEKEIAGRPARDFLATTKTQTTEIWVDDQTNRPVRLEIRTGGTQGSRIIFSDVQWNPPVDQALLSLTPPQGYKLLPAPPLEESLPTEKSVSEGLKAMADFNGGTFPDGIDIYSQTAIDMARLRHASAKQSEEIQYQFMTTLGAMGRMSVFMHIDNYGTDWHYAGAGVALGAPGRPVMWYRPKGSDVYHVIDADLTIHEVKPEDLPKIPSTLVGNPAGQPATAP